MLDHAIRLDFEPWKPPRDYTRQLVAGEALRAELAPALDGVEKHPLSEEFIPYYRLTPAACAKIADLLKDLVRRKRARLGLVQLVELLDDKAAANAEWFVWRPRTEFDLDGREDGITRVKADRIKGRQPVRTYSRNLFLSDGARDALAAAGLGSYETFWVADVGKYRAVQWHHLIPTAFAGRGVDHPWFDPATRGKFKREGFEIVQPTKDPWLRGANVFEFRQIRADPPEAGKEMKALLGVLRDTQVITYEFNNNYVSAPFRLLRQHLPRADVAYAWQARPMEKGEDDRLRYARVCVSRKARSLLMEKRLAKAAEFEPMIVLDRPPKGAAVFDGPRTPPAPPILSPEEIPAMRALEAKLLAKHRAKAKPEVPVKPVPLKPLLAKLKREVKARGGDVAPGAKPAEIAAAGKAAGMAIPKRWAEVLEAMNGFLLDGCAIFEGEGELQVVGCGPEETRPPTVGPIGRLDWPGIPRRYLEVGNNDFGDAIVLDTRDVTRDGDCPVLWLDHETTETVYTWPSISLFLKDAVEAADGDE